MCPALLLLPEPGVQPAKVLGAVVLAIHIDAPAAREGPLLLAPGRIVRVVSSPCCPQHAQGRAGQTVGRAGQRRAVVAGGARWVQAPIK